MSYKQSFSSARTSFGADPCRRRNANIVTRFLILMKLCVNVRMRQTKAKISTGFANVSEILIFFLLLVSPCWRPVKCKAHFQHSLFAYSDTHKAPWKGQVHRGLETWERQKSSNRNYLDSLSSFWEKKQIIPVFKYCSPHKNDLHLRAAEPFVYGL